jgi:hypothetical protein
LEYVANWKPAPRRSAVYVGEEAGRKYFNIDSYAGGDLSADQVLVVGPGGGARLAENRAAVERFVKSGGNLLTFGLDEAEANSFLPFKVSMKKAEHIAASFDLFTDDSLFAGVGPADVHNRDPRQLSLITGGATVFGDGVLAKAENFNVIFCQMAPWQFEPINQMNLKRTYRRSSCLANHLLANMGVQAKTPLLERFSKPLDPAAKEARWLEGFYLDQPEEWDDPYRHFRW